MQTNHSESPSIDSLLDQIEQLHTPPEIAHSLLRLTRTDDFDVRELVDCVARDPAMSARILHLVNSSQYGLRNEVSSLQQALVLLGPRTIRLFALTFAIVETLSKGSARRVYIEYWRRALTMAMCSSRLAERDNKLDAHQAYTTGLLADVGMLALACVKSAECNEIYGQGLDGDAVITAEEERFGFHHAAMSARLLKRWNFSQPVWNAVCLHHDPPILDDPLAVTIQAASLMADVLWHADSSQMENLRQLLTQDLGLSIDEFCDLCLATKEAVQLEADVFGFDIGQPEECTNLLDQAQQRFMRESMEAAMDLDSLEAIVQQS